MTTTEKQIELDIDKVLATLSNDPQENPVARALMDLTNSIRLLLEAQEKLEQELTWARTRILNLEKVLGI
jgi:hypothetical protein